MHRFYKLHLFLFIYRENIDLRLFRACRDGDQTAIASLLERGADPSKLFSDPLTSSPPSDAYSCTPVHIACHNGHLNCLKLLVKAKTLYSTILDSNHQTLLHIACEKGHKQIVHYVLTHTECNVIVQDIHGNSPLHIASCNGNLECVKLIFETSTVKIYPDVVSGIFKGYWYSKQTALHMACESGHKYVVDYLLTRTTCKPDVQDFYGNTPLHVASRKGHIECVKLIVEARVDLNITNKNKQTAIFMASKNGHSDIVEYLLTHAKCNPNIKDSNENTLLHIASCNGQLDLVKLVFETSTVSNDPDVANVDKQTALHMACMNGHKGTAEWLLTRANCNPNLRDKDGNTPLHTASRNGHLECVKLIVETRVDLNIRNKNKQTAIFMANVNGHSDIVEWLLTRANCNPNLRDKDGNTPLHTASHNGHLECVKLIIETSTVRVDLNLRNINKQTALHLASENGHKNIAEYLLTRSKCNPNIQDDDGNTPLHIATWKGDLELVKLVVESSTVSIDPDVFNHHKQTALHMACKNRYKDIVEYMLTHTKCNPNVQHIYGNTPLHIASRDGYGECVKLIIETSTVSVDPNLTNINNQTALHLACENGHRNIAEYLLAHSKCNSNIQDDNGNTPLHIASQDGYGECVKLIIETSTVRVDLNLRNINKQTALHLASENGHKNIAEYLLTRSKCNPNIQDDDGNTLLHIATWKGDLELVKLVVESSTVSIDPDVFNNHKQTALHMACKNRYKDIVEYMLTHTKCNPNVQHIYGNTPLHIASRDGYEECVKLIIETSTVSVDPNLTNINNQTALHLACESGHRIIAEYLLTRATCNSNIQDDNGNTPLHIASRKGFLECVKLINATGPGAFSVDPNLTNINNQTALHLASENGHRNIVEYLLTQAKCNANIQDDNGNTPLHIASRNGHLQCVMKLTVETSTVTVDPNLPNKMNQTALHLASENGHRNIVEYLLTQAKCNANIQDDSGNTPLHIASRNGHLQCVMKLTVETSTVTVDPNLPNKMNQTALHLASENGHRNIVEYLLTQAKCNANIQDDNGNTPLHIASRNGHLQCVMKLTVETSTVTVDPNLPNKMNQTALHLARENGYKSIAEYLLIQAECNPYSNKQTVLHMACKNGYKDIVEYMLTYTTCDPNVQDNYGNTPLHFLSRNGDLQCVKLIVKTSTVRVDPNLININRQTALHLACENGHVNIVEDLLVHAKFNPNVPDIYGNTAVHIATWKGDLGLVKLIFVTSTVSIDRDVSNKHIQTALHIACEYGHTNIVEYLLAHAKFNPNVQDDNGNTALHIATRKGDLGLVNLIFVTSTVSIDRDVSNNDKQTALHIACGNGHSHIAEYLLTQAECNPYVIDKDGDTPLHIASKHGHLNCVEVIVVTGEVDPDELNYCQQTALHLACKHSYIRVVNFLLVNTTCNPTLKNKNGSTPLNYALSHDIIRLLIQHGTDPQNVYKTYGKVLGKNKKQPPKSHTKVVITGDSGTGKTTLVEALMKEKSFLVKTFTPTDVVTEVETNTAGIIPHEFKSKNYGNVTFYDLAGHREYYSSHSAVLRSLTGTCPPATFLVTDISKCDDDVKQSLTYWVNFLENQFPEKEATKLPVIVVGSHLDKVSNISSIGEKTIMIQEIINDSDSIEYGGFVPINCQQCESAGMTKLRQCLKVFTPRLQTQERICFNAHCFHVYLDKYRDLKAVSLRQVQSDISEDGEQNMEQDVSYFLPESLYRLRKLCEDFNDRGIVLFLKDATNLPDSWIVMDKSGILSEINGTVFAADNEHLASSTGVVPVSKLKETFPHYDMKMLVGVLQYLEFCHDVCEQLIMLIHKQNERDSTCMEQADAPIFKQEHHLFFPSLVRVEAPNDLWEPNPQYQVHFGWIIQCTQLQKSFLPRFQSVLCNRLAFKFALAPDPEEIDPTIPALQRKCSVWKNGIYWGTRQGTETLVEVDTHCKSVVLLMQCRTSSADFRKLRFEVIQTILKCAEEFCPKIKTAVSLIARKDISYPLKPVSELTSISLPEVITAVRENSDSAVSKDGKPTPLEDLIGTGTKIEVSWLLLYTVYNYIRISMSPMIVIPVAYMFCFSYFIRRSLALELSTMVLYHKNVLVIWMNASTTLPRG